MPALEPRVTASVSATLDQLKLKLLDLSKRNRLINYRPTPVSSIAIVDELPAEIFRLLAAQGKAMRFRPLRAGDQPEAADETDADELLLPANGLGTDATAADRHLDLWLQTRLPADRLDRSLRRISSQAASVLEEQGFNSLFLALGMLKYYESETSEQALCAPLLLLPVALERRGAGQPYTLKVADDDPVLNPALAELLRSQFGITLPEPPEITEDLDPTLIFTAIEQSVAVQRRWAVTGDIVLGLFSFHKFVMFKDLERNKSTFEAHRIIRQLVERKGAAGFALPGGITTMDLDGDFSPEATHQVVDADSSQQRAIAVVAKGHDLVLEGPPGTGKSQSITNLIANALAEGKRVLFVSEKMAALEVVHSRLQAAELGNFCLALHSQKANKKAVLEELARSIDATLNTPPVPPERGPQLRRLRDTLTGYATTLHRKIEPLGWSPYQGFGELERLSNAPRGPFAGDVLTANEASFEEACVAVRNFTMAVDQLGLPGRSPWRDVGLPYLSDEVRRELIVTLGTAVGALAEFASKSSKATKAFGLTPIERMADAGRAASVADVLENSPGAAVAVLASEDWNSPPPLATQLIAVGRRAALGLAAARERFATEALECSHKADIEIVHRHGRKLVRLLIGEYRRVRRAWLQMRQPGYMATFAEQATHLREADSTREDLTFLRGRQADGARLFGIHWAGVESDWSALEAYVSWVVQFRELCVQQALARQAAECATQARPDVRPLRDLVEAAEFAQRDWDCLGSLLQWPADYMKGEPASAMSARARELQSAEGGHATWMGFVSARDAVLATVAAPIVPVVVSGELASPNSVAAFRRAFVQRWLDAVVAASPVLRDFSAMAHEHRIQEFGQADRKVLIDNRSRIQRIMGARAQEGLNGLADSQAMVHLRGQIARGRKHAPLRKTLRLSHDVIKTVKPCFMMSPITVAQFLDPDDHRFDLVVFDEASQVTAEDAVGAIIRGDQLVVVGDPKQLPPTSFFSIQSGQIAQAKTPAGEEPIEDYESILERFMASGAPVAHLRWHYRSRHESLIAFSNLAYYSPPGLFTFPSADVGTAVRGLCLEFVPDGIYEGAGLNRAEAHRVAEAVMEHARQTPELTLGVGTFNLRQQIAVQDELERLRREAPDLEPFFAPKIEGGFFVKNLENIQGDDRDVIFLSVTYAKGLDGRLRHNFGPLNGDNGWRRLNVLVTRSRLRMRVFSSMHGDEIDLTKTQAKGARDLRDFLLFAERGTLSSTRVVQSATESPFEEEVAAELTRRGVRIVSQVGVAGYRIDFGVLDDVVEGRFICGIECDGALYHSAETARDRDRLRQEVLEGLGWTLHRVWSTDWFKDRAASLDRLLTAIQRSAEAARAKPNGRPQQAPPAACTSPRFVGPTAMSPRPPSAPCHVPRAPSYRKGALSQVWTSGTLTAPEDMVIKLIAAVVKGEAPLHKYDLLLRVANALGDQRTGARITARIERSLSGGLHASAWEVRDEFVYAPGQVIRVRNRDGSGIPGERIAPEEYAEALRVVLSGRGPTPRDEIITMVRELLGFSRTGGKLQECIERAIDAMVAIGAIGQGATGLALRGQET